LEYDITFPQGQVASDAGSNEENEGDYAECQNMFHNSPLLDA